MNTHLPQAFLERMEEMLKEEFPAFLESYQAPRQFGLRINTRKISTEKFLEISPFILPLFHGWKTVFFMEVRTGPPGIPIIRQDFTTSRNPAP